MSCIGMKELLYLLWKLDMAEWDEYRAVAGNLSTNLFTHDMREADDEDFRNYGGHVVLCRHCHVLESDL